MYTDNYITVKNDLEEYLEIITTNLSLKREDGADVIYG